MEGSNLAAGTVVDDRYTIEGALGEGGMAMVFRVRHNGLGTLHALKVLTIGSRQIRERLLQEGRVQATLSHPNIVAVTDQITLPGGSPGLIMELVDGPSLDDWLNEQRLTLEQADELARGILAGVAEAHRKGTIHRDLKPANILLQIRGEGFVPKVADFGLAKILSGEGTSARTRTGSTMGTPHYMSPEQVRDAKHVGPRADVFALGAILYEMVTGRRAFEGNDLLEIFNKVAQGDYVPPRQLVPDLPERMEQAIVAALQTDQEKRPASVEALLALWTGEESSAAAPRSAFDTGAIALARSLAGSFADSEPPAEGTWTGSMSDPAPATSEPDTLEHPDKPATASMATAGVALAGLGGVALLAGGLGIAILAGGALYWATLTTDVPEVPEPAPAPVQIAAELEPEPVPDIEPEPEPEPEPAPAPAVVPAPAPAPAPVATPEPVEPEPEPEPEVVEPEVVEPEPEPVIAEVEPEPEADPEPVEEAPPEPELTPFLASPDPAERRQGIDNLANRPNEKDAIPLLGRMVREDDDGTVRRHAWATAQQLWLDHKGDYYQLQDIVVWQLANGGERSAIEAARALGANGEDPALLKPGLANPNANVRLASLDALVAMAPRAPSGTDFEALVDPLTDDRDDKVARRAREALSTLP